jgi:hypothetical protein
MFSRIRPKKIKFILASNKNDVPTLKPCPARINGIPHAILKSSKANAMYAKNLKGKKLMMILATSIMVLMAVR